VPPRVAALVTEFVPAVDVPVEVVPVVPVVELTAFTMNIS
jgi:hypothetical protein